MWDQTPILLFVEGPVEGSWGNGTDTVGGVGGDERRKEVVSLMDPVLSPVSWGYTGTVRSLRVDPLLLKRPSKGVLPLEGRAGDPRPVDESTKRQVNVV